MFRKISITLATFVASLSLLGCASSSSRIAVLQNPDTKQTVECRPDPWGDMNLGRQVDKCIATYQKAGYKLLSDSNL